MEGTQPAAAPVPQQQAPRSAWGVLVPVLVMLVLFGLGGLTSFIGLFFPWASANCTDADTHPICDPDGQVILAAGPMVSAGIGVALAVVGCIRWPRGDWVFWALGGYSVTVIGFFLFYGIASSGP
jgi:hypothetical protein